MLLHCSYEIIKESLSNNVDLILFKPFNYNAIINLRNENQGDICRVVKEQSKQFSILFRRINIYT